MTNFGVKTTRDKSEIREAQRLRFEVFNLEMKKGLKSSHQQGLDVDEYDPYCEHLIIRDLKDRQVIGTYRLLLPADMSGFTRKENLIWRTSRSWEANY